MMSSRISPAPLSAEILGIRTDVTENFAFAVERKGLCFWGLWLLLQQLNVCYFSFN